MITLKFKQLLVTAILCILCIPASAQFQTELNQYANSNWEGVEATFTLTEIAEALGTDAATLSAALDAWAEDESGEAASMFFLADPNDNSILSDNYTQGSPGGFWVNDQQAPAEWGTEGLQWFNYLYWELNEDEETDEFGIVFGQYPDALTEGGTITPHFVLKFNDKEVTFDITYNVLPLPDMPEVATIVRSELNIVGSAVVKATRTDIQGYDATALSIDATDIIEKLGVDESLFGAFVPSMVYAENYDTELGVALDELTNESTAAGAPGFWLRRTLYPQGHELQGEPSPDVAAATYGADCHIFLEAFAYDEESNAITCNLGQYPGTPAAGDSINANIYLLYGDKAYRISYQVLFEEAETKSLDEMTSVGNISYELTFYDDFADYQTLSIDIDMEAVAAALGCEQDAIQMTVLKNEEALWVGEGTANNGGFWVDGNGFACNWGSTAATFFEPAGNDYTVMNVGMYPDAQSNVGETYPIRIYFINGSNYYNVDISCTVAQREQGDQSTWQILEKRPTVVQVIASAESYIEEDNQTTYTLTAEQISNVLGSTEFSMYCALHDTIATDTQLYALYSKYLCSPAPGIWFNAEGTGSGYNGSQVVGICWDESTGAFEIYQQPGTNASGTTLSVPVYFIDSENGKILEVDFTIQFVDEIKSANIVGTENITLPVSEEMGDLFIDIDLEKPATALGVTVEELLGSYGMKGMKSTGLYSEGVDPVNMGLTFDRNGFYDEYGIIYLNVVDENDTYQLLISASDEVSAEFRASATFCFEINEQLYVYNVTFLSQTAYADGIENISADAKASNGKIYDLSGRLINNPTKKGIYIKDGKKYIVK